MSLNSAFYKFNAAAAEGKSMLSMLLGAKATRTDVSLAHIIGMP